MLSAAAARLLPVEVDGDGLNPAKLPSNARIAFVTPSHQFPTGAILPLVRRLALLEWAKRTNAVVVEDDYDGEFRYEGQLLSRCKAWIAKGESSISAHFRAALFRPCAWGI